MNDKKELESPQEVVSDVVDKGAASRQPKPPEIGGYKGPEPTRYGDWEQNGRCTDF